MRIHPGAPGVAALAAALVFGISGVSAQTAPSASDLAARIQARYATVRDFTADFTLRHASPLMPKAVEDRGEVKVKKPGRMRWTYSTGERQQFISDGTMMYAYFPRDRYAERTPVPRDEQASTDLLFLAGRGDLNRDFVASLPAAQPEAEWHLLLRPRTPQSTFETLLLQVDRRTLALRGLVATDDQGGTRTFRFTNLRENAGLQDREFEFTPPRGVEVR
jgi:outer membrane lipoprotein carrier protein